MPFVADLHIHSKYSRACSKNLDLPHIWAWAQLKGIDLMTVSDFTHPAWFKAINEQLTETNEGIYALKEELEKEAKDVHIPELCKRSVRFILTTEVSLIYKKNGRVRKVHHVIMAPNLKTAAKINIELNKIGNIKSDGRPILGLASKELLKMLLNISPDIQLIPAHIWTPYFAVFGSKSGYDAIEECFDELAGHITALETGLSSDPRMNDMLSQLDKYVMVSNSDAHSLPKIGREATIFNASLTYPAIIRALRHEHHKISTIEFFPEEGKYHADGLRNEELCLTPEETKRLNFVSPKSGKKITVGVLHRVNDLADRKLGERPSALRLFFYIIPLVEIIAEILRVGTSSQRVQLQYFDLLNKLGSEFFILKDAKIADIINVNPVLGEAIRRMRAAQVIVKPGYDGEFGKIKLFQEGELQESMIKDGQMVMF